MKQTLLSLVTFLITLTSLQAQDIITKRTGEKVEAKVLEISLTEIKYKRYSNLEGPIYSLPKAEVMLIQYENKTNEVFELPESGAVTASAGNGSYTGSVPVGTSENALQQYNRGQTDAEMFYEGYKTASTVVLVTSLLSPLVGLVPAIGTSTSPPKMQNLEAPNYQLLQNPDYAAGYKKKARKMKSAKVWTNWGIGLGANLLAFMLIANSQ
ncbi:hypothetical protein ABID22_001598 [Pontibacter aydingkolensis]|uniref:Uncharacterized protein n=1 Tax=Pontibacter aydingkolensis TaxID=1911536 RepID=A0ABS7CUB6_9BACT|nr:hypothetical protein [Pontibacter aydingkolensis]MBW7467266.1 hypothetical protein [Pontibacter aydingkolensis]